MNPTTALTGMIPAIVVISAALTAVAAALLLRLYQRATLRAMDRHAGGERPASRTRGARQPPPRTIAVRNVQGAPAQKGDIHRRAAGALWRSAAVHTAGAVVYATIMSLPWLIVAGFSPGRFVWLVVVYVWPVVPTLVLVAATRRRDRIAINVGYFATVALAAGFVLARNDVLTLGELIFFWIFANGAGTVLLLTFLNRRVRAVGPIVLSFMVAGVTGAFALVSISGESDSVLRALVTFGDMVGLGAGALFVLMHVAGFVVFAFLGWWLLGWLGRRYRAKSFSDQSLTVDSIWLLFGIVQSITLAFEGWGWRSLPTTPSRMLVSDGQAAPRRAIKKRQPYSCFASSRWAVEANTSSMIFRSGGVGQVA